MRTVVSKFGGSSTADAHCFREIRRILDCSSSRRCVVLSAPGPVEAGEEKVTSLLLRLWRCREKSRDRSRIVEEVAGRFRRIAVELGLPDPTPSVAETLNRAAGVSEAELVSRGEWLCASLFSRYSGIPMVDAARVIAFDNAGSLDLGATLDRFGRIASLYSRFVLPGFYGADGSGRIHTFPRNGSDITGALAAAGIGAALYENWTDVPGLMTADPVIVPEARLIPQISYRQMRRLARAGARVLHPACLDPVAAEGIPTRLRSFTSPGCFGTLIDDRCDRTVPCLSGLENAELPKDISRNDAGSHVLYLQSQHAYSCQLPMNAPSESGVSRIDVFGVSESNVRQAAAALCPICAINGEERFSVFVERDKYVPAVRALHRMLIE